MRVRESAAAGGASGVYGSSRRLSLGAAMTIAALVYATLVGPALLSGRGGTSEAADQNAYHAPIVRTMVEQWPNVDIVHYRSATAPGYHLVLAAVSRLIGDDLLGLRLINGLVGLGLVLAVVRTTARAAPAGVALLLALPLACSSYVLSGSIWLTTDNAALLWVTLAWGGAVMLRPTPGRMTRWGLYGTAAVFVRQVHLWPAGVLAIAGLLASPLGRSVAVRLANDRPADSAGRVRSGGGLWTAAAATLATAMPCVALAVLATRWGGLTPPAYRSLHAAGANPVTLAVALSLLGGFGLFYVAAAWPSPIVALRRVGWQACLAVGALSLAATVIWPTTYDMQAGRWGGGLWTIVSVMPTVGGRSVVLPPLAVLGSLVLLGLVRAARRRGRGVEAALVVIGLAGFVVAQSLNSQCWQRYLEPTLLIALAWLAALAGAGATGDDDSAGRSSWWWLGPAALAATQLVISSVGLYGKMIGSTS